MYVLITENNRISTVYVSQCKRKKVKVYFPLRKKKYCQKFDIDLVTKTEKIRFETDTIQLLYGLPTDLKLQKAFKEGMLGQKQSLTQVALKI